MSNGDSTNREPTDDDPYDDSYEEFEDDDYEDGDYDDEFEFEDDSSSTRAKSSRLRKMRHKLRKRMEVRRLVKSHDRKAKRSLSKQKGPKLSANQKMAATFVCTLVLLTILSATFSERFKSDAEPEPLATEYEFVLNEASVKELVAYASSMESVGNDADLPSQVEFINKQIEIADRIESLEQDDPGFVVQMKLRHLSLISRLSRIHQQHSMGPIGSKHYEYIVTSASHSDSRVRQQANLCVCYCSIDKFLSDPSDENFKDVENQVELTTEEFIGEKDLMEHLLRLVKLINANEGNAQQRKGLYERLSQRIRSSDLPDAQTMANELMEFPILSALDFDQIAMNSDLNDSAAVDEGLAFVRQVAESKGLGKRSYLYAVHLLELFEKQNRHKLIASTKSQLIESARGSELPQHQVVQNYAVRSSLKGRSFSLSRSIPRMQVSDSKVCTLLVFYDLTYHSNLAVDSVKNLPSNYFDDGLAVVLVNYVPDPDYSLLPEMKEGFNFESVSNELRNCTHVPAASSVEALKFCPVQNGPYIFLLDNEGEVAETNISNDKIRSVIDSYLYK